MSAEEISLDIPVVEKGIQIFTVLSEVRPEKSLSFVLTEEGVEAVKLALILSDWGIGGNKPKLKATALECLEQLNQASAGDPVNVNFTEYEIKSMAEVVSVFEKALEQQQDGVLAI